MQAVILDMDPGVDDALAIILALRSPELEVLGISIVSGNVPLENGTTNALRVLGLMDRNDVAVYSGASRPLVGDPVYATHVHGPDGLGEAVLPDPGTSAAGDGVEFLVETLSNRPDEVTLIATGPLTNLALAHARKPGILSRAQRLIVMGGVIAEPGNVTPVAEFNFYADPHAAQRVVRSGAPLTLITLDVTHRVGLESGRLRERVAQLETATARFIEAATRTAISLGERIYGYSGIHLHDPVAIGLAIDPSLFAQKAAFLDVETEGGLTAGEVVSDRRPFIHEADKEYYRVEYVTEVDSERFIEMFLERLLT